MPGTCSYLDNHIIYLIFFLFFVCVWGGRPWVLRIPCIYMYNILYEIYFSGTAEISAIYTSSKYLAHNEKTLTRLRYYRRFFSYHYVGGIYGRYFYRTLDIPVQYIKYFMQNSIVGINFFVVFSVLLFVVPIIYVLFYQWFTNVWCGPGRLWKKIFRQTWTFVSTKNLFQMEGFYHWHRFYFDYLHSHVNLYSF